MTSPRIAPVSPASLVSITTTGSPRAISCLFAIVLARRGQETVGRTLGRSGGEGAARAGKWLGVLALWIAATTGLALGFYFLLTLFAD